MLLIIVSCFTKCGTNYYYTKEGGLRPKENRFNIKKLTPIEDYKLIDTNAIYINDRNWFYKFYSNNKVGFSYVRGRNFSKNSFNPLNGKMGYYELKDKEITIYIFIKNDSPQFLKEKLLLTNNLIKKEDDTYKKIIPLSEYMYWTPDW
jgi:hypothetical protein